MPVVVGRDSLEGGGLSNGITVLQLPQFIVQLVACYVHPSDNLAYRSALHSIWLDNDDTIHACLTANPQTCRVGHVLRHRIFRFHAPSVIFMASRHAPMHEGQPLIVAHCV